MVWEHKHIANEKLEAKFEGQGVTLRHLLKLDILPGVPKTWPGDTYDYFWIVDFPANSNVPSKFTMVKQDFGTSFPDVPANDWDTPDGLDDVERLQDESGRLIGDGYAEAAVRSRSSSSMSLALDSARRWRPGASGLSAKKRPWNCTRLERWPIETIAASGSRLSSRR